MKNNNVILLLALSLFALCANAQESPLQNRFAEQYEKLTSQINQRENSAAELRQVKAIWLSTQKQLIAINAEIDAKKLDISMSSGQQQTEAIDELVAIGGAREHTLLDGINKLDKIKNGEPISASQNGLTEVEAADLSKQKGRRGKSGVSFSIEPEDVGSSGLP